MRREMVHDLHFIAPLAALSSICQFGILCHDMAERVRHRSIANQGSRTSALASASLRVYVCISTPIFILTPAIR